MRPAEWVSVDVGDLPPHPAGLTAGTGRDVLAVADLRRVVDEERPEDGRLGGVEVRGGVDADLSIDSPRTSDSRMNSWRLSSLI
jgi:hypothetical protein